jgi:hypothetical protein
MPIDEVLPDEDDQHAYDALRRQSREHDNIGKSFFIYF